jgi:cysteinyl-tRNA synthetase
MLQLWNTLHRALEPFAPLEAGKAGIYTCGPTVYYFAHIGNLRTYLCEDVLVRTLRYLGYEVNRVINITDVGHLVGDGDEGEDKVEREAKRVGKTAWDIAKFYEEVFFEDFAALRMIPPSIICRATEHIAEQIALVEQLEKKGFVYRASDGMYFDTSKFERYGSFSGQKLEDKAAGARVEVREDKRHPTDFVLWKFSPTDAKRQMEWESPWGVGCPGWHIECSAMAEKYLGQPFDIHCGGVDHIPVHHENEIAQSEAANDKTLANYWLHTEFITVDGQKMSKSLGNGYTLKDIRERGFDPIVFRYFCLGAHYRSKLNFTWEALQAADNALQKIKRWVLDYKKEGKEIGDEADEAVLQDFRLALEDDLNTSKALALVHGLLRIAPSDPAASRVYSTLLQMDHVLGLGLADWESEIEAEIPAVVQTLFEARQAARASKQWVESDRMRDALKEQGWLVEDGVEGGRLRKV